MCGSAPSGAFQRRKVDLLLSLAPLLRGRYRFGRRVGCSETLTHRFELLVGSRACGAGLPHSLEALEARDHAMYAQVWQASVQEPASDAADGSFAATRSQLLLLLQLELLLEASSEACRSRPK